jgi:hypothetical protein
MGLFLALAPAALAGTFAPHVDYPAGAAPSGVATGDFNHDGKPDLAVSDRYEGTVSVLLGNGDGTFQAAVSYQVGPLGAFPQAVTVGDFNQDGNLDLAVVEISTLTVLLGHGDGTFGTAANFSCVACFGVATADFNGDGILDVATAGGDVNSGCLEIFLGNGDGTFKPGVLYPVQADPLAIAVGDFNGDHKVDVVVGNILSDSISVLIGNGDGTFQSAVNYSLGGDSVEGIVVGDFNDDQKLDIAIASVAGLVGILLGNGDGTFGSVVWYLTGSAPFAITIGDFNHDGKLDVATAGAEPSVSVLLGNGDGTLQPMRNYPIPGAQSITSADLNGDGELDLVTGDNLANSVSVLLNTGGTFLNTTSSANPSEVGQPVTFTTTVTPSVGTGRNPMGTVTFKDGNVPLGKMPVVSGQASLTTSSLSAGKHTIHALYSGNSSLDSNDAPPLTQIVNP